MERKAVPWILGENPMIKTWSWQTDHFEARITATGKGTGFTWKVVDCSGTDKEVLEIGETDKFVEAEEELLEIVGKSYPIRFGYGAYAGDLATTFTIKTGIRADFAKYVGSQVIMEVFNKKDPERPQVISGVLIIDHFNIQIRTDRDSKLIIPPAFIISVRKEFDVSDIEERKVKVGSKRVFKEEYRRGCTGSPGYIQGTVVHNPTDEFCPIHDS